MAWSLHIRFMQSEVLMPSRLTQRMADWGQGGLAKRPSLHTKMAKRAATVELRWDPILLWSLIQLRSKNWSQPPFEYKDLRTTLKGRCGTQLCSTFQHWCPGAQDIHLFEVVRKTHGIQRFKPGMSPRRCYRGRHVETQKYNGKKGKMWPLTGWMLLG